MKFRLTYEGELRATQRDALENQRDPLAVHKHRIRREFHGQLKRLWETNRTLREWQVQRSDFYRHKPASDTRPRLVNNDPMVPLSEVLAESNEKFGHRFVPLVREDLGVLCSLDILFLRRDAPGSAIQAGDIVTVGESFWNASISSRWTSRISAAVLTTNERKLTTSRTLSTTTPEKSQTKQLIDDTPHATFRP